MWDNAYLFREMPVHRAVLSLAVPTVISQIVTVIYNMADTFFIGQLNDPDQVAAATVAMPAFVALTALSNLFGIGGASKISRCLGTNDGETAKKAAAFSIWTAFAAALLYGVIIFFVKPQVLPALGANMEIYGFCSSYVFWTITIGAVPTVLNTALAHLIRAEGYARQAGFGVAFGGVLNIVLDPFFIFVLRMEITGAAIATMLSNTAAALYFLTFLYRIREKTVITPNPCCYSASGGIPREVVLGGLPSFVMMLLGCLSNSVLNRLVTSYSNEAMAGMGIAKKIDMIAFSVAQGMTQGVLPLIAYNYASGSRKRMSRAVQTTLGYTLIMACAATLTLFLFASPITRCFIDNDETVSYGRDFLRVICFTCPSTAVNFMVITVFQATKQKVQPLLLSLLRKGSLDIPLMIFLNASFGVRGIAWATPLADWIALVVSLLLFLPYINKFKQEQGVQTAAEKQELIEDIQE
ncbi:MATE family efflux transporter [uncultured Dysosmobacter sp.]|uniref:MATE family efflux transporter n=1 Tax=uncultured Dysosmobacter sp. TaxID=2591384 RepID=UPI00260442D2|nr:MATE family efflux transporter [uncultured Dysosmobacter sp.]